MKFHEPRASYSLLTDVLDFALYFSRLFLHPSFQHRHLLTLMKPPRGGVSCMTFSLLKTRHLMVASHEKLQIKIIRIGFFLQNLQNGTITLLVELDILKNLKI